VTVPAQSTLTVTATPTGSSWDISLRSLADCSGACLSSVNAAGSGSAENLALMNVSESPLTRLVAVGANSSTVLGTYDLSVATTALPSNAVCTGATVITADVTINGEDARLGGPRPTGTGCGFGTGSTALYYRVTIPAGQRMRALTSLVGSGDIVLFTVADCDATTCTFQTDSAPEQITVDNTGTEPLTRIVGVRPYNSTSNATYGIAFAYAVCGNGVIDSMEQCDDGGTTAGDGCSATCTVEAGYSCAGSPSVCTTATYTREAIAGDCRDVSAATPVLVGADDSAAPRAALPFSFPFFRTTVTHYSVTSNGLLQVFPSDTGTGSASASNVAIPSTSAPNGFIAPFWDDLVTNGGVRSLVVDGRFVVEWSAHPYGASSSTLRFQAHVLPSGVVEVHYCAAAGASDRLTGSSATIGLENLTGIAGAQQSFNAAGAATVGWGYRFMP
jgi:cysteine-rich repeat protein